jgi:hypothetical protein
MPKYGWYILIFVLGMLTYLIMKRKKVGITQINLDDYMKTVFGKGKT